MTLARLASFSSLPDIKSDGFLSQKLLFTLFIAVLVKCQLSTGYLEKDCIYHFPIDLEQQTDTVRLVQNQSVHGEYNLISV